jgi:hypothetical protein
MFYRFIIGLPLTAIFAFAPMSAQSPAATDAIRCESCALTGQKPEPFDPAKNDVVTRVEPLFFSDALPGGARSETTLRDLFIARVLGTSPLRLEMLDSRAQHVDRKMAVVVDDIHGGRDPGTCGVDVWRTMGTMAVAANVKSLVATLHFNDLVTGTWILQRDRQNSESLLDGRPVVSELRKVTGRPNWFHPVPATPNCENRSGRLIVYNAPAGGLLTVYNDGGIQYSTQHGQVFAREGLSAVELKELLAAFGDAAIDTAPALPGAAANGAGSRLLLAAARYQMILTDVPPPALAPVMERLNLLKARAMSSARLILRTGAARAVQPGEAADARDAATALRASQARTVRSVMRSDGTQGAEPMNLDKTPEYAALGPGGKYLWPPDLGVRLADVPADGLIVPGSDLEKHKLVYYGLLNAGFNGVTFIDGERLYENVRLCQKDRNGTDHCAPK